jgi:hypothetical protein
MKNPADLPHRPWARWLGSLVLVLLATVSVYIPADADEIIEDGTAEEELAPGIKLRIESCGYDKPRQILVSDDDDSAAGDDDDAAGDDDDATGDDDDATGDDDDSASGDDDDSASGDDDDSAAGDDDDSAAGDDDDSAGP